MVDPFGLNPTLAGEAGWFFGRVTARSTANWVVRQITGNATATVGTAIYDWFHPEQVATKDPVTAQVAQVNSPENTSRTIPWPMKKKGKYTCICRADANGRSECNTTNGNRSFAFGWGVAKDVVTAWKIAERMAKSILGARSVHHVQCKCTGSKGKKINRGTN